MARILLGVTGSIAAYRSPDLVKALVNDGHEVRVIATQSAAEFVGLKSLETFSGASVLSNNTWDKSHEGTDHIRWARWAELTLVYGATANILAKLAHNLCDDFLTLQIAASKNPTLLVPAMNVEMWSNILLQENVQTLQRAGMKFIGPIAGRLACGEVGLGHVADIVEITEAIRLNLAPVFNYFLGKKCLVTLGSMRSMIDPVRFIQNSSSGKMGLAFAESLKSLGANVTCLVGCVDTSVEQKLEDYNCSRFSTVKEYETHLESLFPQVDILFSAAAVLDFEVEAAADKMERKSESELVLKIQSTKDFVAWAAAHKKSTQKVISFSLETGEWPEVFERAFGKMRRKNSDAVVVNRLTADGSEGPNSETTQLKLLMASGERHDVDNHATLKGQAVKSLLAKLGDILG